MYTLPSQTESIPTSHLPTGIAYSLQQPTSKSTPPTVMSMYNMPWRLRRFLPWYPENHKQTPFDRQFHNISSSTIDRMVTEGTLKYDYHHLKGDGKPNVIPGKYGKFDIEDLESGKIPGLHGGSSRMIGGGYVLHEPERPTRGSRSGRGGGHSRSRNRTPSRYYSSGHSHHSSPPNQRSRPQSHSSAPTPQPKQPPPPVPTPSPAAGGSGIPTPGSRHSRAQSQDSRSTR